MTFVVRKFLEVLDHFLLSLGQVLVWEIVLYASCLFGVLERRTGVVLKMYNDSKSRFLSIVRHRG